MRAQKQIVALAVTFFIATVMIGLVAASPAEIDVTPEVANLVPGSFVYTNVHLYKMGCDGYDRILHVTVIWTNGNEDDLTFNVNDLTGGGTAGPEDGSIDYTYTPSIETTEYDIRVGIKAALGTEGREYEIYYNDNPEGWDTCDATVTGITVPEFATIVMPVVAILGLLFFFNHRKHRKE